MLATIADETTARQLKQARADFQAATQRAELPLPSAEALKVAEDNLNRLEKLTALSNVPAVEYEKARSEVKRLRGLLESERIERDRNLAMLEDACKKLEGQMKNSEIRSPMDGLLTAIKTIDGELVADRSELFTVSSRKNYVPSSRSTPFGRANSPPEFRPSNRPLIPTPNVTPLFWTSRIRPRI